MKGKARQLGMLWNELAVELGFCKSGVEIKNEYNYLLNQFKKHHLIAKRSGEGAIKWPYYAHLKDALIKNPSVTPVCTLDSRDFKDLFVEQKFRNEDIFYFQKVLSIHPLIRRLKNTISSVILLLLQWKAEIKFWKP